MFSALVGSLLSGIWHVITQLWWLFAILLGAKYGPRFVRGMFVRRGGLQ